jgi:hypothetical protein
MIHFDPAYKAALRSELQRRAVASARPLWKRPRAIIAVVGTLGALTLGGTAAATAGLLVLPGANNSAPLGEAVVAQRQGTASVDLGSQPKGATNIAVEFWCLSAGTFTLGDGSIVVCNNSQVGSLSSATLPLADGQHSTSVTTSSSASWKLSAAYVNSTTTPWAINAHGQSYGVANEHGAPDLIAVQTSDGRDGYAFAAEVADADGTTAAKGFKSPQEALDWQKKMAGKSVQVPVYLSDGTTRIGDFVVTYPGP